MDESMDIFDLSQVSEQTETGQELITQTQEPLTFEQYFAETDIVLLIIFCLGVIAGSIFGMTFMSQWKVGA